MILEIMITALIVILAIFIIYKNIKKEAKGGCNCSGCSKSSCSSRKSSTNIELKK
ncbi:FeoB-associated Cys-rich membrane protein [uncultured Clostridium sp.]|uniref:FeoB-associated Cys-rich membrane protein n=1 Tax=uncultured Clostridium sp. TaxID=59620 RepID=UPI002635B23C|nr:FeoB-associated Cys-rich membrane protein [uncultured Clostridium sp.]